MAAVRAIGPIKAAASVHPARVARIVCPMRAPIVHIVSERPHRPPPRPGKHVRSV